MLVPRFPAYIRQQAHPLRHHQRLAFKGLGAAFDVSFCQ